jgi:hypothetical protein
MQLQPGVSVESALRARIARLGLPGSLREAGYQMKNPRLLAEAAAASHFNATSPYRPSVPEYEQLLQGISG